MSMADLVVGGDYWGPDRDATGNHSDSDTDSDDESDILWLEEAAQEAKEKQKFIDILKLNPCETDLFQYQLVHFQIMLKDRGSHATTGLIDSGRKPVVRSYVPIEIVLNLVPRTESAAFLLRLIQPKDIMALEYDTAAYLSGWIKYPFDNDHNQPATIKSCIARHRNAPPINTAQVTPH